jgi:amino acid adenylation domain-containing protein
MLAPPSSFEPFPRTALQGSIVDRFREIALRHADRAALCDLERKLTYAELAALVGKVAGNLARELAGRDGPVVVLMPHDLRFPSAILSVLAAARIQVPLDPTHPIERNRVIADRASAAAVLSIGDMASQVAALFPAAIPVLDFDRLARGTAPAPPLLSGPDDVAQILYTSGSTGAPKGVYNSHRNCLYDILALTNRTRVTCEDVVALLYSPSVIGGIKLTLGALLNGAALHVLSALELKADGLAREIRRRQITVYASVPALFRQIVEALPDGERLDSVRIARLSGDRVDWSDFDLLRRASPRADLIVSLGATECSPHYAEWIVDDRLASRGSRLPVGLPTPDMKVEILGANSAPVADGEVGEFVVTSRQLALGYWQAPELTDAAFSPAPGKPGWRIFRTGDMGRRRADGLLEFVGRKDQQIKLRGHRIEPAEIEAALRAHDGVHEAAIMLRQDRNGDPISLVAYVEGARGAPPLRSGSLLAHLDRLLPRFMLPAAIFVVDSLPRLPSLKLDRARLAEVDARRQEARADGRDDPVVDEIASLFERLLGVSGARGEDGFYSLGGDSLRAVAATVELERRYGVAVPAELLDEMATIADLARHVRTARPHDRDG